MRQLKQLSAPLLHNARFSVNRARGGEAGQTPYELDIRLDDGSCRYLVTLQAEELLAAIAGQACLPCRLEMLPGRAR